jgi:ATP phosphoribosyltransferase regulatory subunit HisZ
VHTPALEYESVLARGDMAAARPTHRLFDEHGDVLALRSDMTVPIARVVANRYAGVEPPLRFCYFARAYRGVRPQRGHPRELLQAGIELVGAPAPGGTAEALGVLCTALDATGLRDYRVGLGDASLYPALLRALGVPSEAAERMLGELAMRDLVGLEREVAALELEPGAAQLLLDVPQRRGGPEVLADPDERVAGAVAGLRAVHERLDAAAAARIIFDLGLFRELGYYTGAVFEVYDPALGAPLGRGGRYDELLARFGRPLPAVGFALDVQRLHVALTGEERMA